MATSRNIGASSCCHAAKSGATDLATPTFARRSVGVAGWIVPSVVLAVMPKCPACVAAYIALATGIGISFTSAAYVRAGLMTVSVAMLAYMVVRSVRRVVAGKSTAR